MIDLDRINAQRTEEMLRDAFRKPAKHRYSNRSCGRCGKALTLHNASGYCAKHHWLAKRNEQATPETESADAA